VVGGGKNGDVVEGGWGCVDMALGAPA
jgi:hypothetical protein